MPSYTCMGVTNDFNIAYSSDTLITETSLNFLDLTSSYTMNSLSIVMKSDTTFTARGPIPSNRVA